ncbi:hypothetical protein AVEN_69618-1 [Araneus ventricosus]|uniref:Uncharacterized protein n=1 Tax=Araneus ventricosus TaxID=182803 RepID=A0A4Y2G8J5_ARAVE|nr:hypothetical protein AVEN_69618-1 [Araneus ventricosus]
MESIRFLKDSCVSCSLFQRKCLGMSRSFGLCSIYGGFIKSFALCRKALAYDLLKKMPSFHGETPKGLSNLKKLLTSGPVWDILPTPETKIHFEG